MLEGTYTCACKMVCTCSLFFVLPLPNICKKASVSLQLWIFHAWLQSTTLLTPDMDTLGMWLATSARLPCNMASGAPKTFGPDILAPSSPDTCMRILLSMPTFLMPQRHLILWITIYSLKVFLSVMVSGKAKYFLQFVLPSSYIDDLLGELCKHGVGCHWDSLFAGAVCYADDPVLPAPSPSAMRIMLNCCENFAIICLIVYWRPFQELVRIYWLDYFSSYCLSLYGCGLWLLSSPALQNIEVAFNKILRRICEHQAGGD